MNQTKTRGIINYKQGKLSALRAEERKLVKELQELWKQERTDGAMAVIEE